MRLFGVCLVFAAAVSLFFAVTFTFAVAVAFASFFAGAFAFAGFFTAACAVFFTFADFFSGNFRFGLDLLHAAERAECSGVCDFVSASFADNYIAELCDFSLRGSDFSLDLVSLHDAVCDFCSAVDAGAFRIVEQSADIFVYSRELGFLGFNAHLELCNAGNLVSLLYSFVSNTGSIALEFFKKCHWYQSFLIYDFSYSIIIHVFGEIVKLKFSENPIKM